MTKPKKVVEQIYKEDWITYDGPMDIDLFRKAINHPQFKRIGLDHTDFHYGCEVEVSVYIERDETEEEVKQRQKMSRILSQSAKKAAETRNKNKLEEERREYERLKKKFES